MEKEFEILKERCPKEIGESYLLKEVSNSIERVNQDLNISLIINGPIEFIYRALEFYS